MITVIIIVINWAIKLKIAFKKLFSPALFKRMEKLLYLKIRFIIIILIKADFVFKIAADYLANAKVTKVFKRPGDTAFAYTL